MENLDNANNGGIRTSLNINNNGDDRLSSLPDPILTNILSHLPIKSAAATSILSHRWRHLWTGLTRLSFTSESAAVVDCVLGKLTYPKLVAFRVDTTIAYNWESIFPHLFRRNVEEIQVIVGSVTTVPAPLYVPYSVFYCRSLVKLELFCIDLDCTFTANDVVNLPNLKKLGLRLQDDNHNLMKTLFKSCPVLEDLHLVLDLYENGHFIDIVAPNLKTFFIEIISDKATSLDKIMINTPKLEKIMIYGSCWFYCFVENPTMLVKASINQWFGLNIEMSIHGEECFSQFLKFIHGMSSVSHLKLSSEINLFTYLNSVDNGVMPMFHNLVYLHTFLCNLSIWKDLLLSLRCFPNLKRLDVSRTGFESGEQINWSAPEFVPNCLLSKLKIIKIKIKELNEIGKEIKVLEFILNNASVLEELRVGCHGQHYRKHEGSQLWNEYKFCEALFKLSMRSSTCKVLFEGAFIKASKDDFKNGVLDCQVCYFE